MDVKLDKKSLIKEIYKKLNLKLGHTPTYLDLTKHGISRNLIRYYFGNLNNLRELTGIKKEDKISADLLSIYKALGVKGVK